MRSEPLAETISSRSCGLSSRSPAPSSELEKARNRLHVLTDYTKGKQIKGLVSTIEKARSEELAKKAIWNWKYRRQRSWSAQIALCVIIAPRDGTLVYAEPALRSAGHRGRSDRSRASTHCPNLPHIRAETREPLRGQELTQRKERRTGSTNRPKDGEAQPAAP